MDEKNYIAMTGYHLSAEALADLWLLIYQATGVEKGYTAKQLYYYWCGEENEDDESNEQPTFLQIDLARSGVVCSRRING